MSWKREIEEAESIDDIHTSLPTTGNRHLNFEKLDAKVATALKKVLNDTHLKKNVLLNQQKTTKANRFHRGRQIAYMIFEYFRVKGNHESILDFSDRMNGTLRGNDVHGVETRWDEVPRSITEISQDNILERMCTMRFRAEIIFP